jgi:hypothetical protein
MTNRASRGSNDDERAFLEMVTRYLDGRLDPHEIEQFNAQLRCSPDRRELFVRFCLQGKFLGEILSATPDAAADILARKPVRPPAHASEPDNSAGRTGHPKPPVSKSPVLGFLGGMLHAGAETPAANAIMWLVMAVLCSGIVLTVFLCLVLVFRGVNVHVDAPQMAGKNSDREVARVGNGESQPAVLSPHHPITPSPHPSSLSTVARLIHEEDCRWAIGSHSPRLGDDLEPGRKLVLMSGLAEVMFQSGVRAVLQGPATLEIGSRKSAVLDQGRLTVRVEDPDAHGFEVHTLGMKYTDLGTEFGVWMKEDGTQEMVVFRGKVRAEKASEIPNLKSQVSDGETDGARISPSPHLPISPSSIVLTANQAIRVVSADKPIEPIAADEKQFVRAKPAPVPFPLFSTGEGLDRGAADKRWEIVGVSTDPPAVIEGWDGKPRPALVVPKQLSLYAPDSREKGQWIWLAPKDFPDGCRWTFRTKFDLSGFDPQTARIEGQFAVDDAIERLSLNGRIIPLADAGEYAKFHPIRIESGFVAGENVVEITIVNRSQLGAEPSPMALCVRWKGTARKAVKRDERPGISD